MSQRFKFLNSLLIFLSIGYHPIGSTTVTCVAPSKEHPGVWKDKISTCKGKLYQTSKYKVPIYRIFVDGRGVCRQRNSQRVSKFFLLLVAKNATKLIEII